MISEHETRLSIVDVMQVLPLALRALMPRDALVSMDEAKALLPSACSEGDWLAEKVKDKAIACGGSVALFRWGDIVAALAGASGSVAEQGRYLTIDEARTYLRYASTNALRMAITRRQILPSARRGRVMLFTREDLDRQVEACGGAAARRRKADAADSQPLPVANVERESEQTKPEIANVEVAVETCDAPVVVAEQRSAPPPRPRGRPRRRAPPTEPLGAEGDPFGLAAALSTALKETRPPPQ